MSAPSPFTRRGFLRTAGGAIVAAGMVSACSEPPAPSSTPTPGGAGTNGSITLYTSEPQAKIDQIIKAFTAAHPGTKVEVFRGGTGDLKARIAAEKASGKVGADVLLAADVPTFEGYKKDGLLTEYTPKDADKLLDVAKDPDGVFVGTRMIPTVIAYNTGKVQQPPAAWKDLTHARLKDQIVLPNPDVSGAAAFNAAVWRLAPGLGDPWFEALGKNAPQVVESNGPVSQAVADGSRPVGIVVDYLVRDLAAKGSPVAVAYPSEGVPYITQPAAIFSSSQNVEGARAFMDFLISAQGQKLAVTQNYMPVRSDVGTPKDAPALAEVKLLDPDLEKVAAEQDAAVAAFKKLVLGR